MSDAKPRPGDREKEQLKKIHKVLDEFDGDIAIKRIREILYGKVISVIEPEDDEEDTDD